MTVTDEQFNNLATQVNDIDNRVTTLEEELGTQPQGPYSDVRARLDILESRIGSGGGGGGGGGGGNAFVPSGTGFTHITAGVQDGSAKLVTNADVDLSAGISGTKITPNFGVQNIFTQGTYTGQDYLYLPRREPTDTNTTLCWTLDESVLPFHNSGTGGTLDLVNNPNNTSSNIPTPGGGLFGGAAGFFSNGGVWTGDTTLETNAQATSISMWVFPTNGIDFGGNDIFGKSHDAGSHIQNSIALKHGVSSNTISADLTISGVTTNYDASSIPLNGLDWNHIGVTWDGFTIKIYVNGRTAVSTLVNVGPTAVNIDFGSHGAWFMGAYSSSDTQLFNLYVDDVRAESAVRDAGYFSAIYNAAKHPDYATALHPGKVQLNGDFGGEATLPLVTGLQGVPVTTTSPLDGYVLTYVAADGKWEPTPNSASFDPLRPFAKDTLVTGDTSAHTMSGLTMTLQDGANTEVSVLVVADSIADAATFYLHGSYKRQGGAPVALSYLGPPNNSAATTGATAWTATLTIVGNDITVVVQEPAGTTVKWTGEIQLTIGQR